MNIIMDVATHTKPDASSFSRRLTRRLFTRLVLLGSMTLLSAHAIAEVPAALSQDSVRAIEQEVDARMGVAVLDTADGTRFTYRGDERFPMSSTFKVLACGSMLALVDAEQESLQRKVKIKPEAVVTYSPVTETQTEGDGLTLSELCNAAVTISDNTAGNLILDAVGGPAGLTAYLRSLGDDTTRLDRTETSLNEATPGDVRDTTTPNAMVTTLQKLLLGDALSEDSRIKLQSWLLANTTGEGKLRDALPAGWQIGDKTGGGGHGTNNDVAIIWPPGHAPLIVAVYLTESDASLAQRNAAIAGIGRLLVTQAGQR